MARCRQQAGFWRAAAGAASVLVLAGTASAAAQAVTCGSQVGVSAAQGTLNEYSRVGELEERAFWPGVDVTLAQSPGSLCTAMDFRIQGGVQGTYDGFTQNGLPLQSDVTHQDIWTRLSLGGGLGEHFAWRASTAMERFERAIEPARTSSGVTEIYTWYWLGAGADWYVCRNCTFPLSLRADYAWMLDGKSDVNLFAFGRALIDFDDEGTRMNASFVVEPPAARKGWPTLALNWHRREFTESGTFPVIGTSYRVKQPAFEVQDVGVSLSWPMH